MQELVAGWRHELHQNPGTKYEEVFANNLVTTTLDSLGIPYINGLGKTGVVAIIEGQKNTSGKTIGLRADMDALPINEQSGQAWASKIPGKMHACGHDGHTATLLGVAKYLSETRNFDGRALLIFQPAEEGGRGAFAMMEDGLFKDNLKCDAVYAIHNWPAQPVGTAAIREGGIMASVDIFDIKITGKGGHAAVPELAIDPVVAGASLVTTIQSIISRSIPATDSGVITVTNFHAGDGAYNVIPDTADLSGTVRTFSNDVRTHIERRLNEVCAGLAATYGVDVDLSYTRMIDPTINNPEHTQIAADAMARIIGDENVDRNVAPTMGGEDFGGMLGAVPGAYIFVGQGTNNAKSPHNQSLHSPKYDFNDNIIPIAMDYFAELVESSMPLKAA